MPFTPYSPDMPITNSNATGSLHQGGFTPYDPKMPITSSQTTDTQPVSKNLSPGSQFPNPAPFGQQVKDAFMGGVNKIKSGFGKINATSNPIKAVEGGLEAGSGAVGAVFSPLAPIFSPIGDAVNAIGDAVGNNQGVQKFAQSKAGQTTARVAEDVGNTADIAQGELGIEGGIKSAKDLTRNVSEAVDTFKQNRQATQTAKATQANVNAVDPLLNGKAKVNAYKNIASKNPVDAQSAGIFKDQHLSPSQQTVNLAQRLTADTPLSDGSKLPGVKFGKDYVQNLKIIGSTLDKTETALQKTMAGDPSLQYNLDKPTLQSKLENLKGDKPGDFIGDNGKIYDNVINFGQKLIQDAQDNLKGGRDARTSFDAESQRKFPSAWKNGYLDTSTPAGAAIKTVRDAFNEHLYDTAPQGSDFKSLIAKEADLLRARDISAVKAAKMDGKNWFAKFAKENPKTANALKYGLGIYGVDKVVKGITGLGF